MKLTNKTKLKDIQPFLWQQERLDQLKQQVPFGELKKPLEKWTCGDFIRILNDDRKFIENQVIGKSKYAVEWLGRVKTFENTMNNIHNYLIANDTKPSDEEKQAAKGVDFPTMQEQIFLKVQSRLGLHSFDDVEKVPLSHYLLICKDESSKHKFEYNLQVIYDRKRRLKSKTK